MAHRIPERYENGIAVLIATGPSLSTGQIELVRRAHNDRTIHAVFGCNDAYRAYPDLDVLYAADGRWIHYHLPNTISLMAELWTVEDKYWPDTPCWHRVDYVCFENGKGLSLDRSKLFTNNHSGLALINLAYLMGIRHMILIGYDATKGGQHFFGKHPTPEMDVESNYSAWMPNYKRVADHCDELGVNIVNCSRETAIPYFRRGKLEEFL